MSESDPTGEGGPEESESSRRREESGVPVELVEERRDSRVPEDESSERDPRSEDLFVFSQRVTGKTLKRRSVEGHGVFPPALPTTGNKTGNIAVRSSTTSGTICKFTNDLECRGWESNPHSLTGTGF